MNAVLLCLFTRRPASFFTVRCCQSEAQPSFLNFKAQPALLVIISLAAALRVLCRKCRQPFFKIGVVGLHLDHAAMLVKIDHRCLLLLGKPCSVPSRIMRKNICRLRLNEVSHLYPNKQVEVARQLDGIMP